MAGPRTVIAAPPVAGPSVAGLLVSARSLAEGRWENGITYEPACIGSTDPDPVDIVGCDTETLTVTGNEPDAAVEWDPVGLYKPYRCTLFGFKGRDWDTIARNRLATATDRMLGAELWRGAKARAENYPNLFLASNAADTVASSATPTQALACLEQYLHDCNGGGPGMIHATAQTVTHWAALDLVYRDGNILRTAFGTIVVASPGYDGSGPAVEGAGDVPVNAATNSVWAYATGIVSVGLTPVELLGNPDQPAQLDRATNTAVVIAKRTALAAWDGCCHGAAELALSLCDVGGAS